MNDTILLDTGMDVLIEDGHPIVDTGRFYEAPWYTLVGTTKRGTIPPC